MTTMHEDELQLGMDHAVMELLERAATASHQTVSSFVLQAAAQRAEEILVERAIIDLSPEAADGFTEALAAPGRMNERLADALSRPARFTWVD